jgi:hypothetical protein
MLRERLPDDLEVRLCFRWTSLLRRVSRVTISAQATYVSKIS